MANKFTEKALIQLHKYNCPVSVDASDNIMIDVSVKRTLNNDLVYGERHPHCSVETCLYYNLPKFQFNLVEKTSYVPFHH